MMTNNKKESERLRRLRTEEFYRVLEIVRRELFNIIDELLETPEPPTIAIQAVRERLKAWLEQDRLLKLEEGSGSSVILFRPRMDS